MCSEVRSYPWSSGLRLSHSWRRATMDADADADSVTPGRVGRLAEERRQIRAERSSNETYMVLS